MCSSFGQFNLDECFGIGAWFRPVLSELASILSREIPRLLPYLLGIK
jgi:hypothetical protein